MGRKTYPTINDIKWYSAAPFNLGPIQIVKYSAFPCGLQAHYDKPGEEPDYLLRRLQNQLDPAHNGRLCLNLQAQVMTDPDTQPVENTLVPWDPEVARWQKARHHRDSPADILLLRAAGFLRPARLQSLARPEGA